MIGKREILDIAATAGLNPHVVEKDYALGWALAGIFAHPEISDSWVFKGGTCLKKCYFETYRFSEDLDFTLLDESHLDAAFLGRIFNDVSEWVYEQTGLELPTDKQDFDVFTNSRGSISCQGKLSYRGPVSPSSGPLPRIKLDLTADEKLVMAPVRVPIFHPYSDEPSSGVEVLSYAYEEAFGEKVRALAERTRPRDLYDVINLYRNEDARPSPAALLDVLRQKCEFKGIAVPRDGDLDSHLQALEAGWEHMLAHQLPALPPVEAFWNALPEFFAWLEGAATPEIKAAFVSNPNDTVIREHTIRLPLRSSAQSHLEVIRFAATNRLCVELGYNGKVRVIEPYSLRRTQDDNIILHAWSVDANQHRSYRVDRIDSARTTNRTFTPRYAVELTPGGPVSLPPVVRSASLGSSSHSVRPKKPRAVRGFGAPTGPKYVYECSYCGKKFQRKTQTSTLNPHKDKNGYPCSGRTAMWVDTKY